MEMARFRSEAKNCGALPLLTWQASSAKVLSRTESLASNDTSTKLPKVAAASALCEDRARLVLNSTPRYAKMIAFKYTNFGALWLLSRLMIAGRRAREEAARKKAG